MIKKVGIFAIDVYQIIVSPLIKTVLGIGRSCRFEETCSAYAKRQIEKRGLIAGSYYGLSRIIKCQPFYRGQF